MSDKKLGILLDATAERDAIHVAIAPVTAAHILFPGQHIGLIKDDVAGQCDNPIGIVDPFLQESVKPGQRFYLCLYQQTVTGMRHHWSHPAFEAEKNRPKQNAEQIIRNWCEDHKADGIYFGTTEDQPQSFDELVAEYKAGNYYVCRGFDTPDDSEVRELMSALAAYTGITRTLHEDFRFSCTC